MAECSARSRAREAPKVKSVRLCVGTRTTRKKILAIKNAFFPEISQGKRCNLKVASSRDGASLIFTFESRDVSSLRASFNTHLRLLSSALKAIQAASL
jgi:tRNA threonylcarbamoyladenosine modification (KEOPS) complex  Pcc1 subunit